MSKEKQFVVKKFEKVAKAIGVALAAILLWRELPSELKKSFSLGDIFKFYKNTPDGHPSKSSIRKEIFVHGGIFSEWSKISDESDYDPPLKMWATKKMIETAQTFSHKLILYRLGCDVINELIISAVEMRDKFAAYMNARNDEDRKRLKQVMLEGLHSVEDYIQYVYWSNDASVLSKIKDVVLPHKEWVRLYSSYGNNSSGELFVFLFHRRCQSVKDFDECEGIIYSERLAIRLTEINARIANDISKVRLSLIRAARSREQIAYLFQKIIWNREEIRHVIQAFKKGPKLNFSELVNLRNETHHDNSRLKEFLDEEMLALDLNFHNLVVLWRIKGTGACDPLLYRIFNAAETLEEYAIVYNLYYGFTSEEVKNDVRQKAFAQMQILASQ
jgi:hypothetical protein